ncbi:MAG: hypothetical protein ACT4O5_12120 [Gammaproteobacteria bacterium]
MTNKTLPELRKMPESELTAEEKLLLHGKGNPNVVMYRKRGQQVVSRAFKPGEKIPEGWEDSPAKCGAPESAPAIAHRGDDSFDEVVAVVDEKPKK